MEGTREREEPTERRVCSSCSRAMVGPRRLTDHPRVQLSGHKSSRPPPTTCDFLHEATTSYTHGHAEPSGAVNSLLGLGPTAQSDKPLCSIVPAAAPSLDTRFPLSYLSMFDRPRCCSVTRHEISPKLFVPKHIE